MLREAIATGVLYTPWPVKIDRLRWRGSRFDFPRICNSTCSQGKGKYYCSHGLAYYQKTIGKESVTVCGYVDDYARVNRELRNNIGNRSAKDSQIEDWIQKLAALEALFSPVKSESLAPLHEISRWASQVHSIAQRMVLKERDQDFSTNFNAASRDLKSLYKASTMLVDAFDYLNILHNPSSAAYGKKRSVDLYKMVDKIRIILMEAEGASLNKKISIDSELRRNVDLYESFKIIPFCLLQNAIKYSFDNAISITFNTTYAEVEMSVESLGPGISDEEKSQIFDMGYRGAQSKKMHHEGSGIGLYIAKIVADAHAAEIRTNSSPVGYQRDGIPVHKNIFSVKIPATPVDRRATPR